MNQFDQNESNYNVRVLNSGEEKHSLLGLLLVLTYGNC